MGYSQVSSFWFLYLYKQLLDTFWLWMTASCLTLLKLCSFIPLKNKVCPDINYRHFYPSLHTYFISTTFQFMFHIFISDFPSSISLPFLSWSRISQNCIIKHSLMLDAAFCTDWSINSQSQIFFGILLFSVLISVVYSLLLNNSTKRSVLFLTLELKKKKIN